MKTHTGSSLISKQLHTQHKKAFPSLLHSPSGHAFTSSAIEGMQRRKREKEQFAGPEKTMMVHTPSSFACWLPWMNVELVSKKGFVHSNSWGKMKRCHMREMWLFLVFSYPRNSKKRFSQSGALPNSNFPTLPIPHSLILGKTNLALISFSCVDIADYGF